MGHLERGTISMTFFIILLIAYGSSVAGVNIQSSINNLFAPWPSFQNLFNFKNCSGWDIGCINANVAIATASIAIAIDYPAILFFTLFNRVNAFFSVITTVLFGPEVGVATVPFLDIAFIGVIVLPAAYEIFRMARGNASAGTL